MSEKKMGMTKEEIRQSLHDCSYGVLSMVEEEGRPYAVPLNYFYLEEEQAVYVHCAKKGKKIRSLAVNPQVSFVVVAEEKIVEELFTTSYRSVIVEGRASFVEAEREKRRLLHILCERLAPTAVERREEVIEKYLPAVAMIRIDIESVSGKVHEAE